MVVTRFAPSPTGYLHLGGARTALCNWLFAKHSGGKFLLRIEDTDLKRNTPTATEQVMNDLKWLGIEWDEGPGINGPNEPYFQSERTDIYQKYIDQLLEQGKAYYCFDTPEELQKMRDQALAQKKPLVYARPEVFPDAAEVEKAKAQGRPVIVRFAVPMDKPIVINDIVRGEVTFAPTEFGDFVIQKNDGYPTYHMAVVVDDELMGVTHVIRGQEHLMNTPGHQALQDALGFRRPQYAHMSVTVSESGGKLSKRERPAALRKAVLERKDLNIQELAEAAGISIEDMDDFLKNKFTPDMPVINAMADHLNISLPEINVVDFFRSGYLPETMVNFLALLGWSPAGGQEIMTLDELIDQFDINRLTKTNSFFDRQKLLAFNTEHIRTLDREKLLQHFKDFLKEIKSPVLFADDKVLAGLIEMNAGARTLAQIEEKCRFAFIPNDQIEYDEKAVKKVLLKNEKHGIEMLRIIRQRLSELSTFDEQAIEQMLRELAEQQQVGLGKVAQPLRVAISGSTVSPPIFDSVKMLGIEDTLARMDHTIEKFSD